MAAARTSAAPAEVAAPEPAGDEAAAAAEAVPLQDDMAPLWPDENAEAAYLSEAKGRGETVTPVAADVAEEVADAGSALPSLETLQQRIPPKILEAVDDLFRAKFTKVTRVPKKALKTSA